MANQPREIYLVRHGETAWTLSGKHTGLTDIPLTALGEKQARHLHERIALLKFSHVFTSPSKRAFTTCELSGFSGTAIVDKNLSEWDYGHYEGLTSEEIQEKVPDWNIFTHGSPGGESIEAVSLRASKVLAQVQSLEGNVLLYSSGHFLRALTALYLGLPITAGKLFLLKPASLSILGFEHANPVLVAWDMV